MAMANSVRAVSLYLGRSERQVPGCQSVALNVRDRGALLPFKPRGAKGNTEPIVTDAALPLIARIASRRAWL